MSSLEGGNDFPGVDVADVDRVSIADLGALNNVTLMHAGELTVYQLSFHGGGMVEVSTEASGKVAGLACTGACRSRLEGRTLVLEG